MSGVLLVRDIIGPDGARLTTQGAFFDSSQVSQMQAYGWRLPLGAPGIPATASTLYDGFTKAPADNKDWAFDWGEWLTAGETITGSQWIALSDLTLSSESINSTLTGTKVWVTGGISGTTYTVSNRITTSGGRVDTWAFTITIL